MKITFQRLAPYETKENVVIKAYFKGKINISNVSYNKTINDSIRCIPGFINPRIIYLPRPSGIGKYNVPVLINPCIKSH